MKYINKKLTVEGKRLETIGKKYGTPTYCYSYKKLKENSSNFKQNFKSFSPLICFSIKEVLAFISVIFWSAFALRVSTTPLTTSPATPNKGLINKFNICFRLLDYNI